MSDKDKNFSDTRQFSVPRNTADSLREQINRANEQSLHRKRAEGASSGNGTHGAKSVAQGQAQNVTQSASAKSVGATSAHGTSTVPASVTNTAHPVQRTTTNAGNSRPAQSVTDGNLRHNAAPVAQTVQRSSSGQKAEKSSSKLAQRAADLTRVTDISSIAHAANASSKTFSKAKKRPTIQRTEVVYEDEGGNTVVSIVKAVVYMIFVVVVAVFLSIAIIKVGNDVFAFVKNDVSVDVHIPEYATLDDITDILYENEVIQYPSIFKLYATLKKDTDGFLAGDYVVSPNMNYDDLRDAFKPQPKVGISEITIPEGYTTDEIIDLMVSYGIGTREGYIDAIQNYDFDYWFLEELEDDGVSEDRIYRLDGYLFPDTYQFYNSSSEVTVLNKLLKRFGQIFKNEYKIQAEAMGYTVDEIITLASMIEKEAGTPSEFFKVSSVFHNRLNNWGASPKLESDATIVYAIQHETGERPQLTNTSYETPYNTYTNAGLPPGPIANPSASAILAALSPAETNYYYFVSDGSITYFSETKEQHQQYINAIKEGTIREYNNVETEQ